MSVFRRRGTESQAISGIDEPFDRDADVPPTAATKVSKDVVELSGPFDVTQVEGSEHPRIDFGSLLVPGVDGMQLHLELNEDQEPVAVSIILGDSSLQLQAFAAPRSEGIWDEVRQEIAEGIRGGKGRAREADGPFGRELRGDIPELSGSGASTTQSVRFIGVDGPRWFLRGLISGAGGADPAKAAAVEEVFRGMAVRRGDQAAPPREPLPIRAPESAGVLSEESSGDGG